MAHTDTYKAVRHAAYKPRAKAVLSSFTQSRLEAKFESWSYASHARENH